MMPADTSRSIELTTESELGFMAKYREGALLHELKDAEVWFRNMTKDQRQAWIFEYLRTAISRSTPENTFMYRLYVLTGVEADLPLFSYSLSPETHKHISISELHPGRNPNTYIVLRLFPTKIVFLKSVFNLCHISAQDYKHEWMLLTFVNANKKLAEYLKDSSNEGCITIINPYLQIQGNKEFFLRIDHEYQYYLESVHDLMEESGDSERRLKSSVVIKESANQAFKTKLNQSLCLYRQAILVLLDCVPKYALRKEEFCLRWKTFHTNKDIESSMKKHLATCFSNLSLCYKRKSDFLIARYFAQFSVWTDDSALKPKLRLAEMCLLLNDTAEANHVLENLKVPDDAPFKVEHNRLKTLSSEDESVELSSLFVNFVRSKVSLAVGSSMTSGCTIKEIPGYGRGIIATRDLAPGSIVMIDRGLMVGPKQSESKEMSEMEHRIASNSELISIIESNPEYLPILANLYCETDSNQKPNPWPDTEFFLNIFMYYKTELITKETKFESRGIDAVTLYYLLLRLNTNSFRHILTKQTILLPQVSMFNHACINNVILFHNNDYCLAQVCYDIKKGEQLFIAYVPPENSFYERKVKLKSRGFTCKCSLCLDPSLDALLSGIKCPLCQSNCAFLESEHAYCNLCNAQVPTTLALLHRKEIKVVSRLPHCRNESDFATLVPLLDEFSDEHEIHFVVLCKKQKAAVWLNNIQGYRALFTHITKFIQRRITFVMIQCIYSVFEQRFQATNAALFPEESALLKIIGLRSPNEICWKNILNM